LENTNCVIWIFREAGLAVARRDLIDGESCEYRRPTNGREIFLLANP